ncbi:hypothetical protein O166_05695 [Pseudogulbenkiania ferrooxidans EGD-HP2]|uniref:Uncharacterized protein n=1 Tax=Pseudogulbenkiania ferrooxidans EGD-HP2 TaxID=1388764 RepID=A0ABN0N884_9NEIS|nr:hypothetical protein O166_05695 [Pseudogulbenkiania ferrooxidans EGD-HP2]
MFAVQLAVADQYLAVGEGARQILDDVHRAVLAAGAADGHCQVAAVFLAVAGQPLGDHRLDVGYHLGHFLVAGEEVDDGLVAAGERAQLRIVIGIGQAAGVKDEIGVLRHAMLEAERFEDQRQLAAVSVDQFAHPASEGVGGQFAGVDAGAQLQHLGQHLLFQQYAFLHRDAGVGQRVAAAGFGEALDQRFRLGFQEQQAHIDALGLQGFHHLGQRAQRGAGAGVHADGDVLVAEVGVHRHRFRQHGGRQIVHAVETGILQRAQRHRLAGTGQAANQYQAHFPGLARNWCGVR